MKFSLDELVFLQNTAFFRHDMLEDMQALGISKADAECIVFTEAVKNANIVQWWANYGDTDWGPMMLQYLQSELEGFKG